LKILCVVSGGDAPGINTCLLRFTAHAADHGDEVIGAVGGFPGLLAEQFTVLSTRMLMPWAGRAGSVLQSSREAVLREAANVEKLREIVRRQAIDHLLVFGGDGTLRHIPPLLHGVGVSTLALPTTIDNDVPGCERSLGFDSACGFAHQSIDGVLATAHALPGRLFMIETLGGTNGNLALAVAHAAGAHAVLVPEYEYDGAWLAARLVAAVARDGYALLILCEGVRGARTLADELPKLTGIRMRDVRLGHAQRGASPGQIDRALAADFAHEAYTLFKNAAAPLAVALVTRGGRVVVHEGALPAGPVLPDRALYERINGLAQ